MSPHAALLEVPIFGPSSAAIAADAGAARLELNATGSYPLGGTTPSVEELVAVNTALHSRSSETTPTVVNRQESNNDVGASKCSKHAAVPVRVMIRPRGPPPPYDPLLSKSPLSLVESVDFQYTPAEVEIMEASIFDLKKHLDHARGDGLVFGAVTVALISESQYSTASRHHDNNNLSISLDKGTCRRLVAAAQPFPCVFHRAFDLLVTRHKEEDLQAPLLDQVRELGFHGILTSGGVGNAADHAGDSLAAIADLGCSRGLEIIVGGGVRSSNVANIMKKMTNHNSSDTMDDAQPQATNGAEHRSPKQRRPEETQWYHSSCLTSKAGEQVDREEVAEIVKCIKSFRQSNR